VAQGCPHGQPWSFNPAGAFQRTGLLAASTAGIAAALFELRFLEIAIQVHQSLHGLLLVPYVHPLGTNLEFVVSGKQGVTVLAFAALSFEKPCQL